MVGHLKRAPKSAKQPGPSPLKIFPIRHPSQTHRGAIAKTETLISVIEPNTFPFAIKPPYHTKMPRETRARKEESVEAGSDVVMEENTPTSAQPESRDDMSVDQDENEEGDDVEEEEAEEEVQRVRLVCRILTWRGERDQRR